MVGVVSSNLIARSIPNHAFYDLTLAPMALEVIRLFQASLAQSVEQLTLNQLVRGSSPRGGTRPA